MGSGEHSVLEPLFDLVRLSQDRYYIICTAFDAIVIVAIAFLVTNPLNLALAVVQDGEDSIVSFAHLSLHEHTIRPQNYERDSQILVVAAVTVLYTMACIPIRRDSLQKTAHIVFMLASASLAILLVVFAYLSKSTQSHSITNECTVAWYVLGGLSLFLSANRLFFYLAMRTVLLEKKIG